MIEWWLQQAVDKFWEAAGGCEPFPRSLESSVLWALPLAIVKLPRLWIRDVENWLNQVAVTVPLHSTDRPLRGCLIVYRGRGFVFLNGVDEENERRFSLAHEVAHFLLDYWQPRERAISVLGTNIASVFDGLREPTVSERVSAVLNGITVGPYTHLMNRETGGRVVSGHILDAETRADRLALELLAPASEVRQHITRRAIPALFQERIAYIGAVLTDTFGLPPGVAERYSKFLCFSWYGGPSVRERLGI